MDHRDTRTRDQLALVLHVLHVLSAPPGMRSVLRAHAFDRRQVGYLRYSRLPTPMFNSSKNRPDT